MPKRRVRNTNPCESLKDLDHVLQELQAARRELVELETTPEAHRAQRAKKIIEPLSRLDLARRFLVGMLHRHGWGEA